MSQVFLALPDPGALFEYADKDDVVDVIGLDEEPENSPETELVIVEPIEPRKPPIPPDYFLAADIFIAACGATPLFLRIWCNGSPNYA